ncbi:MAG TPA: hypothetical protein VFE54_03890, partial [Mucilaginibacter sp.]|nr:hypothetical protein [Mucilaginibacter sp.]
LDVREELSVQLKIQEAKLTELNRIFDEKITSIDERDAEHTYNTSRAMFLSQSAESNFENALSWAVRSLLYSFKTTNTDSSNDWIEIIREDILTKELKKKRCDEAYMEAINIDLDDLKDLKNNDVDKLIGEVKATLYKIIYA